MSRFINEFRDKPHLLEIHAINRTCLHRGSGRVCIDEPASLTRRVARKVCSFARAVEGPSTVIVISTGLEDEYGLKQYETAERNLAEACGEYDRARNPLSPGPFPNYLELHAGQRLIAPCIANEDGNVHTETQSRGFLQKYAACKARFLWRCAHQGVCGGNFIPPKKRKFQISLMDVRVLGRLLRWAH